MLYRISVTERGLTGIANIFRSRLSRLDGLLGAGTVPLTLETMSITVKGAISHESHQTQCSSMLNRGAESHMR